MSKMTAPDRTKHQAAPRSSWKMTLFRYSLPVLTLGGAVLLQAILQSLLPKNIDFPYAFFYLVAAFVSAWYGGYVPGVIVCLAVIVGLPFAAVHFAAMPKIDFSRLALFAGVSILISRTATTQRRAQEKLQLANALLDQNVQERTRALVEATDQAEMEAAGRRRTEAALSESENTNQFALESAEMGRFELDVATGALDRSLRHDQIFGYDSLQPEWTWAKTLAHVVPEDRQQIAAHREAALPEGEVWECQCRIKPVDQEVRWISMRGRIRRGADHKAKIAGVISDITAAKLSEQRLRTQLERLNLLDQITRAIGQRQDILSVYQVVLRTLEDSLPVDFCCVCLYESGTGYLTVTCIGVRSEELGMELAMMPNSRIMIDQNGLSLCVRGQLVYESDLAEAPYPFPERLMRAGLRSMVAAPLAVESSVFGMLISARRDPHSFSSGECEFLRQLTEHVALAAHQSQIYTALQQAYDDLRQSQQTLMQQERLRALGQMASGIAHDVNNALSPVALYTEYLLEAEPGISPRGRDYLTTIQRAIGDVSQTVARMREFYRQQEPKLVLVPVDLGPMVQQVLDLTRARWSDMAQRRGVTFQSKVELAASLPPIAGVESEIREALTNLVFNALDAMPEGGTLTVRTKAPHPSENGSGQVSVEVQDSGIGMDEDTRRRCLEPFFTTKGERGTGLGLAMVYGVVQRHNGQIEIDSTPGAGTTMRLKFPPLAGSDAGKQKTEAPAIPARMRILVVDDDPLLIKSLRDTLEWDGHLVVTTNGGKEGIETFGKSCENGETFGAVITDLGMPYVDGRKVAATVKSLSPATPVILLTGWGQRLVAEGDVPPHVDRVLNKPPKLRELRSALAELQAGTTDHVTGDAAETVGCR